MEEPHGTLFVSIPTVLDSSLSPEGTHIVHMFTPDWVDNWQVLRPVTNVCVCWGILLSSVALLGNCNGQQPVIAYRMVQENQPDLSQLLKQSKLQHRAAPAVLACMELVST